jgi:Asp-tRNA(Asn)/Glu-tRNA(Gln) amidotransferase A subunit family amidase
VVSAGIVPIAIGTDTGGSVRVPAALCGVFGLKVTHGRVPVTGVYPLAPSLDTVGPIAGTVPDLGAAYLAMAGDDSDDPWSQPVPVDSISKDIDSSELRFGVVKQWMSPPHTTEVSNGMDRFLSDAAALGIDIVEIDEPGLAATTSVAAAFGPEVTAVHGERLASDPDGYSPETAARLTNAASATAEDLISALQWKSAARAIFGRSFASGIDALIAPTVGGMRKVIGDDNMDLDGESVFHRTLLSTFSGPINQIGAPAIAAPIAGTGTPPVSVQLIGPLWGESRLLGITTTLETAGVLGVSSPPIYFE